MDRRELRVVRDREALCYSIHLVDVDVDRGVIVGWVPEPVELRSDSSEGLATLVAELRSVWNREIVDREELDGALELVVPTPSAVPRAAPG